MGVMFYGLGYFLVHDTFFYKRIKIKFRPKSKYIKRILNAHAIHHQQSTAHKGICFGFLYASKKYAVTAENPVST
jgi:beta-carotene 3-hydroxylase